MCLVCDEMVQNGAPLGMAYFKGINKVALKVGCKYKISRQSVVKYWKKHVLDGDFKPHKRGPLKGTTGKLSDDHKTFIEYLLQRQPSLTAGEVHEQL